MVAVMVENLLIAMVPLLIGLSIDGFLAGRQDDLAVVLVLLGAIAVGKRLYDTRVYGMIRVRLGGNWSRRGGLWRFRDVACGSTWDGNWLTSLKIRCWN